MKNRRQLARWKLTDSATDDDRAEWARAKELPEDRHNNKTRARIFQKLWKSGAIRLIPGLMSASPSGPEV